MVRYVHTYGRQHGIIMDAANQHIRLEQAINHEFGEHAQCHGICYHQNRIRRHPSWLRKELVYACAGEKGINLLNEVWYNTWIFRINLRIEDNLDERNIRERLGRHMKVERIQITERGSNEITKRMRHLRDEISWSADRPIKMIDTDDRRYFGRRFDIGRDI
ncbi:hypothetical protein N7471_010384 [Penicillium samsonianum]|uniref:uncharacterized protein n=1 Tax=Penicillium samsonianum TaxID=1882272 RepID=UPI0025498E7D|nr:uncharacterized protein N7471_010384 [Penicillium samsonianum]KAJ6125891.1 hypothetical protein N7471_010384 [Penicillium samsonianum]